MTLPENPFNYRTAGAYVQKPYLNLITLHGQPKSITQFEYDYIENNDLDNGYLVKIANPLDNIQTQQLKQKIDNAVEFLDHISAIFNPDVTDTLRQSAILETISAITNTLRVLQEHDVNVIDILQKVGGTLETIDKLSQTQYIALTHEFAKYPNEWFTHAFDVLYDRIERIGYGVDLDTLMATRLRTKYEAPPYYLIDPETLEEKDLEQSLYKVDDETYLIAFPTKGDIALEWVVEVCNQYNLKGVVYFGNGDTVGEYLVEDNQLEFSFKEPRLEDVKNVLDALGLLDSAYQYFNWDENQMEDDQDDLNVPAGGIY